MTRDGHGGWNMMDGTGAWVMMTIMLVTVLALIAVTLLLLRRGFRPSSEEAPWLAGSRASRILDERFAGGEIDENEYRRRQNVLLDG